MLSLDRIPKVYLALEPVDLRKGIDGYAAIIQDRFRLDPFDESLFLFSNRARNKLKCLYYDGTGFWLLYKRLNRGSFKWPASTGGAAVTITHDQLKRLLDGLRLEPEQGFRKEWPKFI